MLFICVCKWTLFFTHGQNVYHFGDKACITSLQNIIMFRVSWQHRKNHNKAKQQPLCPDVTFFIVALCAGQEQIPVLLIGDNDLIVSSNRRWNVCVCVCEGGALNAFISELIVVHLRPHSITHLKRLPSKNHSHTPRSSSAPSAWRQLFSLSSASLALTLSSSPEEVLVCRWLTSWVSAESGLIKTAFDCSCQHFDHPGASQPEMLNFTTRHDSNTFLTC